MSIRSPITTHVLDVSTGKPAANVDVKLEFKAHADKWKLLSAKKTNSDGRIEDLLPSTAALHSGTYRIRFEISSYFKTETFYPYVDIIFDVTNTGQHYHVPLIVSPYGYSTYRGS